MKSPPKIRIYLTPDKESELLPKEIAAEIGISAATFRTRLITFGPDSYLTYYPKPIPGRLRRSGARRNPTNSHSLLSTIKVERLEHIDYHTALKFVEKLILISKRDLENRNCKISRAFLLNEDKTLERYIEPIRNIDCTVFLERLRRWVLSVKP